MTLTRSKYGYFLNLFVLFSFISFFLLTHAVSAQDSLRLSVSLAIDLLTGSLIWIFASNKKHFHIFELFGIGIVIGSTLSTIAQLLTRNTFIQPFVNLPLCLLVVVLALKRLRSTEAQIEIQTPVLSTNLGILAAAMLLVSGDRYYLWTATLLLFAAFIFATKFDNENIESSKFRFLPAMLVAGFAAVSLGVASVVETLIYGRRTTISYVSGWDGVIFEASSKALINYGPFDHIFLSNIKYAYYWFHDAWAGAFTQRAGVADWIVTTQFGTVVVAISSIALLYVIVERRVNNPKLRIFVLAIVASPSLIGAPSALLSLASFSQMLALLWIITLAFLIDEFFAKANKRILLLIVLFSCVLVMTKLTIAVPVIAGHIAAWAALTTFKSTNKGLKLFAVTGGLSILASGVLYVIFIRPEPELAQTYFTFEIGFTEKMFGIVTGQLILDIVIFFIVKAFASSQVFANRRILKDPFTLTMLSISLASLGCALLIEFELSVANTYMLVPFLAFFTLIVGIEIVNKFDQLEAGFKQLRTYSLLAIAIGLLAGAVSTFRLHKLNYEFVTTTSPLLLASLVPVVSILVAFVLFSLLNQFAKSALPKFFLVSIVALAIPAGSYISHSFREVQRTRALETLGWDDPTVEDVESKFNELKPVVKFMATELDSSDVLASNSTSDFGLLAAMTGIRNYASSYVSDMQGVEGRFPKQFSFAQNPTDQTYSALRNECVTWFYYDRDENNTEISDFKPFAEVTYEDETGVMLKLSSQVGLPSFCG
ncbi:MAG: hypothetical protein ACKOPL_08925 [Acidimicrobiaceae bacterium]